MNTRDFDSLSPFYDKIKVNVRKIMKTFGPNSESEQAWLKLLMIRNGETEMANTHGI